MKKKPIILTGKGYTALRVIAAGYDSGGAENLHPVVPWYWQKVVSDDLMKRPIQALDKSARSTLTLHVLCPPL
ncbi:hypothetical protein [Pectobacterium odoriferum]|uniref:hypothetical protein n=1 Tax=Pectobacterium odoriferum TaxID=78398 RepID=UPI0015F2A0CE|nr:hypothetical protein [Pectobacterium odoriferum]